MSKSVECESSYGTFLTEINLLILRLFGYFLFFCAFPFSLFDFLQNDIFTIFSKTTFIFKRCISFHFHHRIRNSEVFQSFIHLELKPEAIAPWERTFIFGTRHCTDRSSSESNMLEVWNILHDWLHLLSLQGRWWYLYKGSIRLGSFSLQVLNCFLSRLKRMTILGSETPLENKLMSQLRY